MGLEYTTNGKIPFNSPNGSEWEERSGETLVSFTALGQQLTGKIVAVGKVRVKGEEIWQCVIQAPTGRQKFFLNHDLQAKISPDDVGRLVTLVWDSEQDTGQETKMRVFRVWLSKAGTVATLPKVTTPPPANDGDPGISDRDLPFTAAGAGNTPRGYDR